MQSKWISACFTLPLIVLIAASTTAVADIKESVVKIPVRVQGPDGAAHRQDITLTIYRDETRKKAPFLILNHGRSGDPHTSNILGGRADRREAADRLSDHRAACRIDIILRLGIDDGGVHLCNGGRKACGIILVRAGA